MGRSGILPLKKRLVRWSGAAALVAALLCAPAGCASGGGGTESGAPRVPYSTEPVELYPVMDRGKAGYIDKTGAIAIPPQFAAALPFSEGLAAVQPEPEGPWGYIEASGEQIIDAQFADVSSFSEGLAAVQPEPEGPWGYIDITGVLVIPAQFTYAWRFSQGLARARNEEESGYIDGSGDWALRMEDYLAVDEFSGGVAPVYSYEANLYGYINMAGEVILLPVYEEAWGFSLDLAAVKVPADKESGAGLFGYIDKRGKWFISPRYAGARPFSEALAAVQLETDGKWGYINPGGDVVISLDWDEAWDFHEGLSKVALMVGSDELTGPIYAYAYIDTDGNVVWRDDALKGINLGAAPAIGPTTTAITTAP
jgi:hypothetical protein